jgi:hypothetical protein
MSYRTKARVIGLDALLRACGFGSPPVIGPSEQRKELCQFFDHVQERFFGQLHLNYELKREIAIRRADRVYAKAATTKPEAVSRALRACGIAENWNPRKRPKKRVRK